MWHPAKNALSADHLRSEEQGNLADPRSSKLYSHVFEGTVSLDLPVARRLSICLCSYLRQPSLTRKCSMGFAGKPRGQLQQPQGQAPVFLGETLIFA